MKKELLQSYVALLDKPTITTKRLLCRTLLAFCMAFALWAVLAVAKVQITAMNTTLTAAQFTNISTDNQVYTAFNFNPDFVVAGKKAVKVGN